MYGDVKTSFNISNTFIPLFLGFSNSKNKAGYSRLDLDEFEEEADYKGEFDSCKIISGYLDFSSVLDNFIIK